ncbi:MAG: T9SS type A sorting domain-containing protein [Bacteroidota bacterium]
MKKKILLICIAILSFLINEAIAQASREIDAYQVEEQGYFTHPVLTSQGIVFTDNHASKLYLLHNDQIEELVAAPGCGRYYTVSPGKNNIGFKLIKPNGMQVPAILQLTDNSGKKIIELHSPVDLCGQVSFSRNGDIAYTIGNILYVKNNKNVQTYDLGTYANIAPISPDGNYAVFNDDHDQLHIINLTSGETDQITGNEHGYVYPQWSPDGNKLVYSTLSGELIIRDMINGNTYFIGRGGGACWSDDCQYIIYQRTDVEDFQFKGSDIFISKHDASETFNLTQTSGIYEMSPIFGSDNNIIYHTYNKREIRSASLNSQKTGLDPGKPGQTLIKKDEPLSIQFYDLNEKALKTIVHIQGDAPYISQVYDMPDFHDGSGSCAPSTALMALGYYNRLPKWEIPISAPYSHTNDYGAYVADKYCFNEIYYDTYTSPYGSDSWGAYSYMWSGGSPNSKMMSFLENHWLTSNQLWTSSCTYSYTTDEIDSGFPHPICSWLSSAGHLTLTVGYVQAEHTLIFNDPYGNKNTSPWSNYTPTDKGINVYYDWPGYNNGYANLDADGTHGGVAWTVRTRSSEPVYSDTIIDDVYYDHGFYMYNQTPSHMKYFRDQNAGYDGHMWWTITMDVGPDICWVTWTPDLPVQGDYEVFVYIPSTSADATGAMYNIFYDGGDTTVIIDQGIYSDQWVTLGTYLFLQGQSGYVYLGDYTGIDGQAIGFDAVKWSKTTSSDISGYIKDDSNYPVSNVTVTFTNGGGSTTTDSAGYYSHTVTSGWSGTATPLKTNCTFTPSYMYYSNVTSDNSNQNYTGICTIPPLVANFIASMSTVYVGDSVNFFDISSGDPTSWSWIFTNGDPYSDTLENPVNIVYNTAGCYEVYLQVSNIYGTDDTVKTCYIDVISGIENLNAEKYINIIPNPNTGEFAVEINSTDHKNIQFKIVNILGQEILSEEIRNVTDRYSIQIDLRTQPKGIYFLNIGMGGSIINKKIIRT